ncbi:hypothetical protein, partial [Cloacibacillus evryensis]|uniref:hypothetical protein n=1 Tax=Cloacibacillus evryensis TaxID=508460 RepID=UPI00241DAFFA
NVMPEKSASSDLAYLFKPGVMTYKINLNKDNDGFNLVKGIFKPYRATNNKKDIEIHNFWIDDSIKDSRSFTPTHNETPRQLCYVSPKTTDAIFLAPNRISNEIDLNVGYDQKKRNLGARAAAISAMHLIVYRAALELDVAPEEFEIIIPRMFRKSKDGAYKPLLQITDNLINGSGLSHHLLEGENGIDSRTRLEIMIHSMITDRNSLLVKDFFASVHRDNCDHSCYGCLQRYGNQFYHGLLDWRYGISFLRVLIDSTYKCGADMNFDYELEDWPSIVGRHCKMIDRDLKDKVYAEQIEVGSAQLWSLVHKGERFNTRGVVCHPLWNARNADALKILFPPLLERQEKIIPISSFDLITNHTEVYDELLDAANSNGI